MQSNQIYLFRDKRFLPMFLVQGFGCLNDNIIKNSLIMLITFTLANQLDTPAHILVMIANVIFISPFVLFASLAGQIADKYERAIVTRIIKFAELIIVLLTIYAFKQGNISFLYICLGLLGIHSTFFGPLKYSVLPDNLHKEELISANGFVEAGTFFAILVGTMLGGFYNYFPNLIFIIIFLFALIGFAASFYMPKSHNGDKEIRINYNIISETISILKYANSKKQVYLAILGISWFWFIGAALLAQIPSLTKNILGANDSVANLFLATFTIGVGVGSFWCNKIFANEITTKYVFLSAIGISIFGIDLCIASHIAQVKFEPTELKSIAEFLSRRHNWRIIVDLFFLAIVGGLYVVPLYAVMQFFSSPAFRCRIVAANNLMNSVFMAGSIIILTIFYYLKFTIPTSILLISLMNMIVAIHIYRLIPSTKVVPFKIWRRFFKTIFDFLYTVEVNGLENYEKAGNKTVIVANHLSYIDPALIATYIPEQIYFAINMAVAREWWVKPFLKIVKTFPLDHSNPMAIKSLIAEVKANKKIAIFPEGRISLTGSLMKIYEGPGMIADKADATILPIRVDGTQFTRFSKLRNVLKGGFAFKRKLTITILPPVKFNPGPELNSRERRKFVSQAIYDVMSDMMFQSSNVNETMFEALINSAKIYGMQKKILQDNDNNIANYKSLIFKSFIVGDLISNLTFKNERIGLMLPNALGSVVSFFGTLAYSRVPAMINFTSGPRDVISACNTALVSKIFTSRKFIEKADLHKLVQELQKADLEIIYLEDLREKLSLFTKLKCLIASNFPKTYYNYINPNPKFNDVGVILFTSGTEGKPKAVALSHSNILSNKYQILARIDLNPHDSAFNTLPMFHTFGLTGMLLMVFSGIRSFLYPSPLHYRIIPELIYDIGATFMFATDTFLTAYANHAHPYDFYSLRAVYAGAEKLKPRTKELWMQKFGVRVFEGYGVTEASPVISANTSMHGKNTSVGRLMPGIEHYINKVEGIEEGGTLCVKGPNIMLGYMKPEKPGIIIPPHVDKLGLGWHDTGDIVTIDEEGYITIVGRQKRFAKIGGEMVSLAAIEETLTKENSDFEHIVVAIEHESKGEQIILLTTDPDLHRDKVQKIISANALSEIYIPRAIIHVHEIPMLSTGKVNYRKSIEIAKEEFSK